VGSLEVFQVTKSFCVPSVALGSTQPLIEMSTKEFPWGKVQIALTADNSAVLSYAECQSKDGSHTFHSILSCFRKVFPYRFSFTLLVQNFVDMY